MERSKWCDTCQRDKCVKRGGVQDMAEMKPECYVDVEMVEYEGYYVPRVFCSTDRLGGIDDCVPCDTYCQNDCSDCVITKVFNEYTRLSKQL